jgi:hypothetical protein
MNPKLGDEIWRFMFAVAVVVSLVGSGRAQDSAPSSDGSEAPVEWRTYTDKAYDFSIRYPEIFVILREPKGQPVTRPRVVHRVRFQDKQLAAGQTAALEPPQFSIEVLKNEGSMPLPDWLKAAAQVGEKDTVERVSLDGAGEGWRVRQAIQLAPNDFYYFERGNYVFKLTPLGSHSEEMLNSFRLLPQR